MRDVATEHVRDVCEAPQRFRSDCRKCSPSPGAHSPEVHVHFGPTASRKSRRARSWLGPDAFSWSPQPPHPPHPLHFSVSSDTSSMSEVVGAATPRAFWRRPARLEDIQRKKKKQTDTFHMCLRPCMSLIIRSSSTSLPRSIGEPLGLVAVTPGLLRVEP